MFKFNKQLLVLTLVAIIIMLIQPCRAYREISGLLDEAKELTHDEINALRPLFAELQLQYDYVLIKTTEGSQIDELFEQQYEATLKEFELQLNNMFPQEATTNYDTNLPSVEEIMGKPDFSLMTKEQQMEFLDMQSILQDALDEAQINLNALVARALMLESNLLKINKPKIIIFIIKALRLGYKAAARVGRAAYCTYSHIPQLNTSLHSLYEGVDCYLYTTSLIVKIQNETYNTVKTVRKNVFELAAVYKKVAQKNSLVGKIVSVILNVTKIARSILDTISTAKHVLDSVENQLPSAAQEVASCGSNFAVKIPFMIESVSNVTECILFVDNTKIEYDFMKPEDEYNKELQTVVPDIVEDAEEEEQEEDAGDTK
ncbi:uncharacterized protein LOC111688527 [Lucilia cuprina]|uniref:uncharacterized protein LOC111688527 n=1 Tax=Lucilia cuprina TaxID=7375 RepID=UPI001F06148A|nr:uncharacterized protein LOC111688527 [Lucilia cuprina]